MYKKSGEKNTWCVLQKLTRKLLGLLLSLTPVLQVVTTELAED